MNPLAKTLRESATAFDGSSRLRSQHLAGKIKRFIPFCDPSSVSYYLCLWKNLEMMAVKSKNEIRDSPLSRNQIEERRMRSKKQLSSGLSKKHFLPYESLPFETDSPVAKDEGSIYFHSFRRKCFNTIGSLIRMLKYISTNSRLSYGGENNTSKSPTLSSTIWR